MAWTKNSIKNEINLANFYNQIMKKTPLRYGYQFTIEFIGSDLGVYTGAFNGNGTDGEATVSTNSLTYLAQSAKLPAAKISEAKVTFYGTEFSLPAIYSTGPGDWEIEFLLTEGMEQYEKLNNWQLAISDYKNSGGGRKLVPSVKIRVNLLDQTHQFITKRFVLEGIWMGELGDLQFAYKKDGGDVLKAKAKFKYQYWYDESQGDGDPLEPSTSTSATQG